MANSPSLETPSKVKDAPANIQESLKSDLSYLDKMRRDPARPDNVKKCLYWYGTLPAIGNVTMPDGKVKTALENWNRDGGLSLWSGKCEWFQNISIRGITFPAFTGSSQRSPIQSPSQPISNGITKAGFVEAFTDDQVKEIIFQADHHMIKPPSIPGRPELASIYRLMEIDGAWKHESQDQTFQTNVRSEYNSSTDLPVSDFVYFIKIKDEFQQQDIPSIMRTPLPSLSGR